MTNHSVHTIAGIAVARLALNPDWDCEYVADVYSRRYGLEMGELLAAIQQQYLEAMRS
jgi:hypothetical protein